jgi:hypothetical protein
MAAAQKDMVTPDEGWVCDRATLIDASEVGVRTKYTNWLRTNAGDVRNVVPHRIKPARYSKIGAVRKVFSMTIEFERKVTPEE